MKKSIFSIFEEIERSKDKVSNNIKMKKSIFNIFHKTAENKNIIFNTFSLAIALVDDDFFKIYYNLEKINLKKFHQKDKDTYNAMISCNFIVKDDINEIDRLKSFIDRRISYNNMLNLSIFPTYSKDCGDKDKKNNITSKDIQDKIFELIKSRAERKTPISIRWYFEDPILSFEFYKDFLQKIINICIINNVKYYSEIILNGNLLTEDFITKIKGSNVSLVHTSIDLPSERNDNGKLEIILENIKRLKINNIKVKIKINIKKDFNIDSVFNLIEILENSDLKNSFYFDACVFDSNKEFIFSNENCFTNFAFVKFYLSLYIKFQESDIKNFSGYIFPKINRMNFCDITGCRSLNIDPEGHLYKCSNEVGVLDKTIGHLSDLHAKNKIFFNDNEDYITWVPFKFKECNECSLIPICYGNCPNIQSEQINDLQCSEKKNIINALIEALSFIKIKAKK